MSMFQLDTAFILEIATVGAGLITLHKAAKEPPAGLLRAAGYLYIVFGVLAAVCTVYYGMKYRSQGDFEHDAGVAARPCPMMKHGGMMDSMMPGGMMMDGMTAPQSGPMGMSTAGSVPQPPAATPDSAAHETHHPGSKP